MIRIRGIILEHLIKIVCALDSKIMDYIFRSYSKNSAEFFFIEIGASDNIGQDQIGKYILGLNWRGIIIEPVKYLFDKLLNEYSSRKELIFENVAIAETEEERDFYYVSDHQFNLPSCIRGIGSFSINHLNKFNFSGKENNILTQRVKCITFDKLIKKYQVKKIDLLQIDTEGYDFEILKTVDFCNLKPRIIHYEFCHLDQSNQKMSIELLKSNGYFIVKKQANILAFLRPVKPIPLFLLIKIYQFLSFTAHRIGILGNR